MRVLITGASGFIGKNLRLHLAERNDVELVCFTRRDDVAKLPELVRGVDFIFHLAGTNRPEDDAEFLLGNVGLTQTLCRALIACFDSTGKIPTVIYTSSIQAGGDSLYGVSKRSAEQALLSLVQSHQLRLRVFRLPNVFGKWCRPNYNSVVATFCHNIARGLPIQINDFEKPVTLVYVDDVIASFVQLMDGVDVNLGLDCFASVAPQYTTIVSALASQIQAFKNGRTTLMTERVGSGLVRALYATYVSNLPPEAFAYTVPQYEDSRGVFVEMLKTPDSGQFSFFTAHPGTTRGGHYHQSKTEKFLVVKGRARFKFRHMQTHDTHELVTTGEKPEVVETVPGWTHDITNVGSGEMIVMLWANEVFDRVHPDTFSSPL
ncbi:MAG: SDR family oxidoreductase [Candidatus Saccharibacteria bacterium]|nr:SDR family oxidoreductase [Rhodoferax sp.]